jgi:hypothetical protein
MCFLEPLDKYKVATVIIAEIFLLDIRPGSQGPHEKIKLNGATPMRLL